MVFFAWLNGPMNLLILTRFIPSGFFYSIIGCLILVNLLFLDGFPF